MTSCRIEFVIEPFVDGAPGPYVQSGIDAMAARGLDVSMGPFGSSVAGDVDDLANAIGAMVSAAANDGARRVLVEVVMDST
jgi:uncharacterized protein YqgV (UPF0045/DUF77 family)